MLNLLYLSIFGDHFIDDFPRNVAKEFQLKMAMIPKRKGSTKMLSPMTIRKHAIALHQFFLPVSLVDLDEDELAKAHLERQHERPRRRLETLHECEPRGLVLALPDGLAIDGTERGALVRLRRAVGLGPLDAHRAAGAVDVQFDAELALESHSGFLGHAGNVRDRLYGARAARNDPGGTSYGARAARNNPGGTRTSRS